MFIKNSKLYDRLKYATQIVIPAVASLYFALAQIWGIPGGAKVVGTLTVLDTFLGVMLKLNSNAYNNSDAKYDGVVNVSENDTKKVFSLDLDTHPDDIEGKKEILLKVGPRTKKKVKKS